MTVHDLRRQTISDEKLALLKTITVALFVISLIGCLAPVTGIVGAILLIPKRKELQKCGPLYQVMAYAALGLSAVYSVLMVIFFASEF